MRNGIYRQLVLVLFASVLTLAFSSSALAQGEFAGVTSATVSGEIEFISCDDINDVWSSGTIQVAGQTFILPRNLLFDLPMNRLTVCQLFQQAPPSCLAMGESGLARSDDCLRARGGSYAHILGNQMPDGTCIVGEMFLQKSNEVFGGKITYINYEDGYFRANGRADDPANTGLMVRLNDPDGVHTIQQGLGCEGGPNCSPDVRFCNDAGSYSLGYMSGYPLCIPSTVPRAGLDGLSSDGADPATGIGDHYCPQANRGNLIAEDSRYMAPMRIGDKFGAEGNIESITDPATGQRVNFLSAHTMTIEVDIQTADRTDQPNYMVFAEAEWDSPGFQNERCRILLIGFTTLPGDEVDVYALDIDPATGEEHPRILGSNRSNPLFQNQGIGIAGRQIWKIGYDVDFVLGAPVHPRVSPCRSLQISGYDVCSDERTMDEEFAIISPLSRDIACVATHSLTLDPGVQSYDIAGQHSQNGMFVAGAGIGHPEFDEINLDKMWTPLIFAGVPWQLDRRLGQGGCIETCQSNTNAEPLGTHRLDPFPASGLNPTGLIVGGIGGDPGDFPEPPDPPLPGEEDCSNGIDDNGDGAIDCADPLCLEEPECQVPPQENCDNGLDDDGDGLVDCIDADCQLDPACTADFGIQFLPNNFDRVFGYWPFTYIDGDNNPNTGSPGHPEAEQLVTKIDWNTTLLQPDPTELPGFGQAQPQPADCAGLNNPPTPQPDDLGVQTGVTFWVFNGATLAANDTDPDGDVVGFTSVAATSANGGAIIQAGTSWLYTAPAGFSGVDSFTYTASDSHGGQATGTVTVTVPLP